MGNPPSDLPEVEAVSEVMGVDRIQTLVLVSHKGSFAHSTSVSGLVALVTTILVSCHCSVPAWAATTDPVDLVLHHPLLLPTKSVESMPLMRRRAQLAGVSGTSTSGDNVHLLMRIHLCCVDHLLMHTGKVLSGVMSIIDTDYGWVTRQAISLKLKQSRK